MLCKTLKSSKRISSSTYLTTRPIGRNKLTDRPQIQSKVRQGTQNGRLLQTLKACRWWVHSHVYTRENRRLIWISVVIAPKSMVANDVGEGVMGGWVRRVIFIIWKMSQLVCWKMKRYFFQLSISAWLLSDDVEWFKNVFLGCFSSIYCLDLRSGGGEFSIFASSVVFAVFSTRLSIWRCYVGLEKSK